MSIEARRTNQGILEVDTISFYVNGVLQTVGNQYALTTTLNEYLREVLHLTGTKLVCSEGGCGACTITGLKLDEKTQHYIARSINSCLFSLYACDKWQFITVEGVGNKQIGYADIQKRLASYNASQCGFCSPGMIMSMFSLLSVNPSPNAKQIENAFDGNLCRCTGYRSILDAMKTFACNQQPIEIEELYRLKSCLKSDRCTGKKKLKTHIICGRSGADDTAEWYAPQSMNEFYQILTENKCKVYKLVAGNTSQGVYKNDGPYQVFIDLQSLTDLSLISQTTSDLTFGSYVSLSTLIDLFEKTSSSVQGFEYLSELATHLSKVATTQIRNVATWSGNLAMKYNHLEFPSDLLVCFETAGAQLKLVGPEKTTPSILVSPSQLLNIELAGRLIYSATFPTYDKVKTFIKTYKVMPRAQNAHAYVNAGFRLTIDPFTNVVQATPAPSIVYGGINQDFVHATNTEQYLVGKSLEDPRVLYEALSSLNNEIQPDNDNPVLASSQYRRFLSLALFYKYVVYVCKSFANPRYVSAIDTLIDLRQISSGQQSFPTTPQLFPLTQPLNKLNALAQAAGEASYVFDLNAGTKQLFGTYFLADVGNCHINSIDVTDAEIMPGVVKIFTAKDIPGQNNVTPMPLAAEKLFCDDYIDYAGQALGLVVATSQQKAVDASKKVKVTYKNLSTPILTINDAIAAQSFYPKPCDDFVYGDAEQALTTAPLVLTGQCSLNTQHHFYMENQVTLSIPTEDGLKVESSTQWVDIVQRGIAQVLNKKASSIDVSVKQLGGAYGGKMTRANIVACGSALAASVLNQPVKVSLNLNSCIEAIGKRFPWLCDYVVGIDTNGKLIAIKMNWYADAGSAPSDKLHTAYKFADNVYKCPNWHITPNLVRTNTPANTSCRSPSTFPAIAIMEHIIEHVARVLDHADPVEIKLLNMYQKNDVTPYGQPLPYFSVPEIVQSIIKSSDYYSRVKQCNDYNTQNRWKKRGISLQPLKWGANWSTHYNCLVSIYQSDGSVAISHGGIESGQGIHTKIAQVCAYELGGLDMDLISVKSTNTLASPNQNPTGGSVTSELISMAAIECCKTLNANLDPVRKQMPSSYTWPQLIQKAFSLGVDLSAHHEVAPKPATPLTYNVYGAAVSEVIIDVLTGELQIPRVDILYDCGQSMNGLIDVTQAEGAFVMGIGFWLSEKIIYDPESGKCLTNGTWEYKPPSSKDIPINFNITFMNNNPNPLGVLGSKCVGEPPLCLSASVIFAVKRAIANALGEIGETAYFELDSPATPEIIQQACNVDLTQLKLK